MLNRLLINYTTILNQEEAGYQKVLAEIATTSTCIGFMPAITDDLYPVYALSCTSAKRIVSPSIYIVPIGAHDCWATPYFEQRVNEFYREDAFREQFGIKVDEMILLNNSEINNHFTLYDGVKYNMIYCRIVLSNGKEVHLFIVPLTPHDCWSQIIEKNDVKCDIIIDSHKGLGDWYEDSRLYRLMRESKCVELLPKYYFRGRYNSCKPSTAFSLKYSIPEMIVADGRIINEWEKELYEIRWQESL